MIRLNTPRRLESWQIMQRRMLRETEAFLEDALRHPERQVRIPAVPVGRGKFPRGMADAFWAMILGAS
jgi:hypothetical protein